MGHKGHVLADGGRNRPGAGHLTGVDEPLPAHAPRQGEKKVVVRRVAVLPVAVHYTAAVRVSIPPEIDWEADKHVSSRKFSDDRLTHFPVPP